MKYEEALQFFQNALNSAAKCDNDYGVNQVGISEIKTAIEAIEKQIPKAAVFNIFKSNGWGNVECKCPICDSVLAGENWVEKHYCDKCGQKLDWSDTE